MRIRSGIQSVCVAALAFAALPASAQTTVSIEGGMACSRGDALVDMGFGVRAGDKGCGMTGALEIARTGQPVAGFFDHWAVRGRFLDVRDNDADWVRVSERRQSLDAELGAKIPGISLFGGETRGTIGLRYVDWSAKSTVDWGVGADVGTANVRGAGLRVGLRSTIPLFANVVYESNTGASALRVRQKTTFSDPFTFDSSSSSHTVFGIDSTSALTYRIDGSATGRSISVGLYSEYAFNQTKGDGIALDRHHWGPFARFRMPLQ